MMSGTWVVEAKNDDGDWVEHSRWDKRSEARAAAGALWNDTRVVNTAGPRLAASTAFPAGIVKWEEPEPSNRGRNGRFDHLRVAEALKASPGTWALIDEDAPVAYASTFRKAAAYNPVGSYEFTARSTPGTKGRGKIYGRYVGK